MQNLKDKFYFAILLSFFLSCTDKHEMKKIKIGNYFVKANFIDNNNKIVDGKAYFYDSLGNLYNVSMYDKGMRAGISINYYPNRVVSDSIQFICDKEHGYRRFYDTNGFSEYTSYYYFGLRFGPELIYKNNRLTKLLFRDFDRNIIAECNYDSIGRIDSIAEFKMEINIVEKLLNGKPVINLFGYLPKFPTTVQSFSIGLTNSDNKDKKLYSVQGHDFFIDTLLPLPPSGWFYYLACNLKANNNSIDRFYIEE